MSVLHLELAWLLLALHIVVATISITHALLYKKDPRSAFGWIAVCFAYPLIGPLLYYLFGINRIRTRAQQLKGNSKHPWFGYERPERANSELLTSATSPIPQALANNPILSNLVRSSQAITHRPLLEGNELTCFFSGDTAYQAMFEAIDNARQNICLSSYLFETNLIGRQFIAKLVKAKHRGVDVRVLLDGVGEWYSFPKAGYLLKKAGIAVSRFIPPRIIPPSLHINLRNHRKLLIVDNQIGFTGGMNIGDRHLQTRPNNKPGISDMHFSLQGKIIEQLQQAFEEDWAFVTHKPIRAVVPTMMSRPGKTLCRVVTDGPNEDLDNLVTIITGAAALAQRRIAIMTPYFLPPAVLINALQTAALRGVEVSIILPSESNQPLVHWATRNMLWELLQYGVGIYYQPPPFNHSKLLLIDEHYAHIGSANLDSRSLRLNFELIVEIFDAEFIAVLSTHFSTIRAASRAVTLAEVDQRSLLLRIRDAVAWLFSPYL